MTMVFSGFGLILYLANHIAKFRRPFGKSLATKRTFLLIANNAVSLANCDFEFFLWLGFVRSWT